MRPQRSAARLPPPCGALVFSVSLQEATLAFRRLPALRVLLPDPVRVLCEHGGNLRVSGSGPHQAAGHREGALAATRLAAVVVLADQHLHPRREAPVHPEAAHSAQLRPRLGRQRLLGRGEVVLHVRGQVQEP